MSCLHWTRSCLLTAAALLALPACGGQDGPAAPDPPGPGPASSTITPADGGELFVELAGGASARVAFPPGAVREATVVTLRPSPAPAGDWASVALEPAGMVFYEGFLLEIVLPEGVGTTDAQLYFRPGDPVHLPTVVDGRALQATLHQFGLPDPGGSTARGPTGNHANNQAGAGPTSCQALIAATQARFDGFLALGEYERAVDAALQIAALLQRARCPGAQAWLDQAGQIACDQLDATLQDVQASPTVSPGDFARQAQSIFGWVAVVQNLAPACAVLSNWPTVLDGEISDFIAFYTPRLDALTANDWHSFSELKDEAVGVFQLMGAALSLGLADAAGRLEADAFLPTIDRMREVAFDLCHEDGWHYPLSRLSSTGFFAARDMVGVTPPRPSNIITGQPPSQYASFTDEDIFDDLQYCATCLEVEALVASGDALDSTVVGTTGSIGSKTTQATLVAPTRGRIRLAGRVGAFSCWDDIEGDTELVFALEGTDVLSLRRLGVDDYIDGGSELIDISSAAMDAGITPSEGSTHELTVRRERTDCDERLWGAESFELATATLQWKNPTLEVEVGFPSSVEPGSTHEAAIRVKVIDQLGKEGFFDGIDIVLGVDGGVAEFLRGETDPGGWFRTNITASGSTPGLARGAGLTIDATATSFEGVTARGQHQATILVDVPTARVLEAEHLLAMGGWVVSCDRSCAVNDQHFEPSSEISFTSSAGVQAACTEASFSGNGSASAIVSAAGDGSFTSIVVDSEASGSAIFTAQESASLCNCSGDGNYGPSVSHSWIFEVLAGDLVYEAQGSISSSRSVGSASAWVRLIGLAEDPTVFEEFFDFSVAGSASLPYSEAGTLAPGRYVLGIGGGTNVSGGCNFSGSEEGSANVSINFNLSVP